MLTSAWFPGLVLFFFNNCRTVLADLDKFIYPGPAGPNENYLANLALPLGSNQVLEWTVTESVLYNIILYQEDIVDGNRANSVATLCEGTNAANTTMECAWTVQTYNSTLPFSPVYFLLHTTGSSSSSFYSHYFNITSSATTTSTTATSSSQATTSSTSTPSGNSASAMASSTIGGATTGASQGTSSDTSDGTIATKVGLGVGLGVGIPLVLIAGIFVGLAVVKQRRSSRHEHQKPMTYPDNTQSMPYQDATYERGHHNAAPPVVYEAPNKEPGWGPDGRYEAQSKPLLPSELG